MEYTELIDKFGIKVKYLRLINKLTQEQFAEKMNVDTQYLSDIECGRRNITMKTISKISEVLKINPEKLFSFDA